MGVYGLQILDATLETGNTAEVEEDTAASALLLKHDGGADDVTLAIIDSNLPRTESPRKLGRFCALFGRFWAKKRRFGTVTRGVGLRSDGGLTC